MANTEPSVAVSFDKSYQKWHARIYWQQKYIHVGRFENKVEAIAKAEQKIDDGKSVGRWDPMLQSQTPLNQNCGTIKGYKLIVKDGMRFYYRGDKPISRIDVPRDIVDQLDSRIRR